MEIQEMFYELETGEVLNLLEISSIKKGKGINNLNEDKIIFDWIVTMKSGEKFNFNSNKPSEIEDLENIKFNLNGGHQL